MWSACLSNGRVRFGTLRATLPNAAVNVRPRTRSVTGGDLMRLLKIAVCAFALAAFTAPRAHADEWNKKTFLTFSGPVQVPGTTLPAGTYMFKLADLETN